MLDHMRGMVLISLVMCVSQVLATDTLYKKVNPDGTVEYSDQPTAGAEEIPATQAPSIKLTPVPPLRVESKNKSSDQASYEKLVITSPANDASIRENTGNLTLQAELVPGVQPGHQLRWLLDGQPLSQTQLTVQLQNVDRGTHQVQVQVVDAVSEEVLIGSEPVTFHLHRYSKN